MSGMETCSSRASVSLPVAGSGKLNANARTNQLKNFVLNPFQVNLYERQLVWPEESDSPTHSRSSLHLNTQSTSFVTQNTVDLDLSINRRTGAADDPSSVANASGAVDNTVVKSAKHVTPQSMTQLTFSDDLEPEVDSFFQHLTRPAAQITAARVNQALLKSTYQHYSSSFYRSVSTSALQQTGDSLDKCADQRPDLFENKLKTVFESKLNESELRNTSVDESAATETTLIEDKIRSNSPLHSYDTYTCEPRTMRFSEGDLLGSDQLCETVNGWTSRSCDQLLAATDQLERYASNEELYDDCSQLLSSIAENLPPKDSKDSATVSAISRQRLARTKSLNFNILQQLDPLPEEDAFNRNSFDCLADLANGDTSAPHLPQLESLPVILSSVNSAHFTRIHSAVLTRPQPIVSHVGTRRNALLRSVGRVAGMLGTVTANPGVGVCSHIQRINGQGSDSDSVSSSVQQRNDESGYESDGVVARAVKRKQLQQQQQQQQRSVATTLAQQSALTNKDG